MAEPRIITLLTDFGLRDCYVGVMKGVIASRNAAARIIDLSHDIRAQDVREAAYCLRAAYPFFPEGTVHVAVVDPGVGTDRQIVAVQAAGQIFLAPDNGLLRFAIPPEQIERIFAITEQRYFLSRVSQTFHGRDIFAPVAAELSKGLSIEQLGEPLDSLVGEEFPIPRPVPGGMLGEIIHTDRFGNLVTNLPGSMGSRVVALRVGGRRIEGLCSVYADRERGHLLALVGSADLIEVSVREGSAAERLGLRRGAPVEVRLRPGD